MKLLAKKDGACIKIAGKQRVEVAKQGSQKKGGGGKKVVAKKRWWCHSLFDLRPPPLFFHLFFATPTLFSPAVFRHPTSFSPPLFFYPHYFFVTPFLPIVFSKKTVLETTATTKLF